MVNRDNTEQCKSSAWSVVLNICCIAIGLGVLSFPFAFRCAGLLGGLILCAVCAFVTAYCMNIIIRHASKHGCNTFQDLVKCSLGEKFNWGVALLVIVYLYGSCVAYQIVVGDTFHPLIAQIMGSSNSIWADRRLIIAVTGLLIVLPISLKRSAFHFAGVSSVAVLVIVFMGVIIMVRAADIWKNIGLQNIELFVWRPEAIYVVPIIIFAFQAHVQSCDLFFELDKDSSLFGGQFKRHLMFNKTTCSKTFSEQKIRIMENVVKLSFGFCAIVFACVGVSGYSLQPKEVGSDIMNCLPIDDIFIQVVRGLVGLSALLHYPINQHVGRAALDDFAANLFGWPTSKQIILPYYRIAACTVVFFVPCTLTAILVTDLGIVFHLLGGIASACFIFIIPGFMLLQDSKQNVDETQDIETGYIQEVDFKQHATRREKLNEDTSKANPELNHNSSLQNAQLERNSFEQKEKNWSQIFVNSQTDFQRSFSEDVNFYRLNNSCLNPGSPNNLKNIEMILQIDDNHILKNNFDSNLNNFQNQQFQIPSCLSLPVESTKSSSFSTISDFQIDDIQITKNQNQMKYDSSSQYRKQNTDADQQKQKQKTQHKLRMVKIVGIVLIILGITIVSLTVFTTLLEVFKREGNGWPTRPRAELPCVLH